MKLFFLALGFIAGYIAKDLLTTESQIIYHIKRLRAKDHGVVTVDGEATAVKEKRKTRRSERLKNKK